MNNSPEVAVPELLLHQPLFSLKPLNKTGFNKNIEDLIPLKNI